MLPGLREIRTPLVTGFIWLVPFAAFLAFGTGAFTSEIVSGISPEEADKLPPGTAMATVIGASLSRIYTWISNPIIAAVLCLAAYVVGSFSTLLSNGLVAGVDRLIGLVRKEPHEHLEFANVVRLVGREPELYELYDRLRAETEFRAGISLPLAAMTVLATRFFGGVDDYGALVVGLWWGFLILAALVLQSVQRHRRLRLIMVEAIARFDSDSEPRRQPTQADDPTSDPGDTGDA
ncbi:hypothetical protein [Nonomuraea sp. NPDC049784]|uniref:hypothetical protein n=1 Tax=Nonomuraea sp. NPDC049784 TaxID=3154361 RepID=UPI0033D7BDFB